MTYGRQLLLFMALMASLVTQPIQGASVGSMEGRKVVLMSMDGFRYDYLNKTDTPNFDKVIASGIKVPYVNNIFASKTFPCHHSIATGLYEESHGILDNKMYDPEFNASFSLGNTETRWWNDAEPIWTSAVKSGLKVGTFFWPGTDVLLQGHRPTSYKRYDWKVPFEERVDTVVNEWLSQKNYDFGILYFNEPDHTGHTYGPDSQETVAAIQEMDTLLGYFLKKLEDTKLKDKVDFILTSDHGMTSIDQVNRLIVVSDYVNSSLLHKMVGGGAFGTLMPQPGKAQELVDALSGIDHIQVYLKEDIPEKYHHKNHKRVHHVLVVADDGWDIRLNTLKYTKKGGHGYKSDVANMRPIFMATGPSFKKGLEMEPIQSVDIYPLLCHLLNLTPKPNNGSLAKFNNFLIKENAASIVNAPLYYVVPFAIFTLLQSWLV